MVVYMYEKLSDGVHTFSMPSERDYYNAAAFTTRGYFFPCNPTSCSAPRTRRECRSSNRWSQPCSGS